MKRERTRSAGGRTRPGADEPVIESDLGMDASRTFAIEIRLGNRARSRSGQDCGASVTRIDPLSEPNLESVPLVDVGYEIHLAYGPHPRSALGQEGPGSLLEPQERRW